MTGNITNKNLHYRIFLLAWVNSILRTFCFFLENSKQGMIIQRDKTTFEREFNINAGRVKCFQVTLVS